MMKPIRTTHPLIKHLNSNLIDLPSPSNISTLWNFGSMLGLALSIQFISGIFLAMHYCPHTHLAFLSIAHISRDVNLGWLLRFLHANGASLFFIFLYLHMGRGIYYGSFTLKHTWYVGTIIFFISMMTAFLGYVLPWGQMSFWGATVITNLLSAIPLIGTPLVQWVWGGFAIDTPTLNRFFTLHFLMPFILVVLIIVHLLFLHQTGSNNPLGLLKTPDKFPFHPYYSSKDLLGFLIILLPFNMFILLSPHTLNDPENFMPANPLVTPLHIQPEWYFLFAYAILRSIPNKLGGVLALLMSILVLLALPSMKPHYSSTFNLLNKSLFWWFINTFFLLTWIGARPVEPPFLFLGQILTVLYFLYYLSIMLQPPKMTPWLFN